MNKPATPFSIELNRSISAYIVNARKAGTVGMSLDNLIQCVRTPSRALEGAPAGTNAPWHYRQLFHEICKANFASFVMYTKN